jgi:hypothetical protein
MLIQFESKLVAKVVDRMLAQAFDKWRNNEKKCPPGSDVKQAADDLWRRFQEAGGTEGQRPMSQRSSPVPARNARRGQAPQQRTDTNNANAADPAVLGAPFHNPYTFLPFPPADWFDDSRRARRRPTPLTADETDPSRFTGTVELRVRTLTPLLTCSPDPVETNAPHKVYPALTSGDDVILPATGVRGSLRTLMTIIAGGTLSYLDDTVWLVQARDRSLGPAGKDSPPSVPRKCFLGKVVEPGNANRPGTIQLGRTELIKTNDLDKLATNAGLRLDSMRPHPERRTQSLWIDDDRKSVSKEPDQNHRWEIKLSGPPIDRKGKREGLFLADGAVIPACALLWQAYLGRNRHGDHPEPQRGDLLWLEPADPDLTQIESDSDIASLQWARWGRKGQCLLDAVPRFLRPDSLNPDGLVDEVTDLFGQVPMNGVKGPAGPFAARIRFENLVFRDARSQGIDREVLAPLQPPHPGCAAFYRDNADADLVSNRAGERLRGYKVYRTQVADGSQSAPWLYSNQGVYGDNGSPKSSRQNVNKTCDLLKVDQIGSLRIACRSLSRRELALLLLACSVDWRLGGGKPLGLGLCRVESLTVRDEHGAVYDGLELARDIPQSCELPPAYREQVSDLIGRAKLWQASQIPVEFLRYPRAAQRNRNKISRGGHAWFARHANPKKSLQSDAASQGLQVLLDRGGPRESGWHQPHQGPSPVCLRPRAPRSRCPLRLRSLRRR